LAHKLSAMPLEGHWKRQTTPLRTMPRRERRTVLGFGLALVIVSITILVLSLAQGSPEAGPGCLNVATPSTMGGGMVHFCGQNAERFCATQAARDDNFARRAQGECRSGGYPARP
jgi:hypothetical protein